jgi:hypothetical protein
MHTLLERRQSATSLSQLLCNPLGFLWKYGMGWDAPERGIEPLVLDARGKGALIHEILDLALRTLETTGGLRAADDARIDAVVDGAVSETAAVWESEQAIPPAMIWRRTLDTAGDLAKSALKFGEKPLAAARSYTEVPFGGSLPKSAGAVPWDATALVEIPGTGLCIKGYIDRLDISADGRSALVRDYKTGRPPDTDIILKQGKELQRCLYAFAVKALLGSDLTIVASLLYLRPDPQEMKDLELSDPDATLTQVSEYLRFACAGLKAGHSLPGPEAGGDFDDLAFALPANAAAVYCKRKAAAVAERLGDAARVWEAI